MEEPDQYDGEITLAWKFSVGKPRKAPEPEAPPTEGAPAPEASPAPAEPEPGPAPAL